jgi:hypothetical protein
MSFSGSWSGKRRTVPSANVTMSSNLARLTIEVGCLSWESIGPQKPCSSYLEAVRVVS